jgi:Trypsin
MDACVDQHESYQKRIKITLSDDIAILTLATPIYANGVTIQYAKLPENGYDLFVGGTGFISGWGKTGEVSPFSNHCIHLLFFLRGLSARLECPS